MFLVDCDVFYVNKVQEYQLLPTDRSQRDIVVQLKEVEDGETPGYSDVITKYG